MSDELTVEILKARFEAAGHYVNGFNFVSLEAVAWFIGKDVRTVQRMLKRGDFLPDEVQQRARNRRISLAGLLRWHLDGFVPEEWAA